MNKLIKDLQQQQIFLKKGFHTQVFHLIHSNLVSFILFYFTGSLRFNTIGIIDDYDNIIYDGEIQNNDFMAYYLKNNKLIGAATFNRFKDLIILREVMNLQKTPII